MRGDRSASFGTGASGFLSHRAFHEQHRERNHKRKHGDHPKGVEIGERRRLLLTQILECLRGQLLRSYRIACLPQERSLRLPEERSHSWVERIEELTKSKDVKLITPLLEGLGQRHSDAAPFVA